MKDFTQVWTKQHQGILEVLRENGRYIVKKEYIEQKMEEHSDIYLDVCNWYFNQASMICPPPKGC